MFDDHRLASRRQILAGGASAAMGLVLDTEDGFAQQALAPTPACHAGEMPTRPQIEGPFFKPASPLRGDLREPGMAGRPAELAGFVLTRSCRPVAGALIELWHADDQGEYDNTGFRLRGHLFADAKGHYAFKTVMPGLYPGRTRHFHIKVQAAAESPVLTTQLYFPDEPRNQEDDLFRPELTMQVAASDDALRARFDLVLAMR
ncbi:MAG TPA: intradiol ring-cleavage dioxygenase [Xanthobacteraceae bacterium]|jgi:protocatechuate 3,4-dioxygenase beta subunit|nr:intradiol ring-cleavage dioxygenase [Xanthobacteraceae bacterium]